MSREVARKSEPEGGKYSAIMRLQVRASDRIREAAVAGEGSNVVSWRMG